MDLLALLGALFGGTAIVAGFLLEGGQFTTLFQVDAFVVVFPTGWSRLAGLIIPL